MLRILSTGILATFLGGVLALSVAVPAGAADVIPPGSPNPVNVLPSTVKGAMPFTGVPGSQQYLATMLYSYARTPEFWRAAAAVNAGTATAGEITLVQQRNGTYAVPATRTQTLTKVVGGVGTAITGYSLGTMIGNGTLDLIGYDADGAVCQNTTGIARDALALLTGVDCSAFMAMPEGYVPNTEVTAGVLVSGGCNAQVGWAVHYSSNASMPLAGCSAGNRWARVYTAPSTYGPFTNTGYDYVTEVRATADPRIWEVDWTRVVTGVPTGGTSVLNENSQIYAYCLNASGNGIRSTAGSFTLHTQSGSVTSTVGANYTATLNWSAYGAGGCPAGIALAMRTRAGVTGVADGTSGGQSVTDGQAWFYRAGSELVVPQVTSGDPLRTLRCVVTHGGGELIRDSAPFRESEGILPQVLCPDIDGLVVESIKVLNVNTEDGTWTVLYEEETTPEYQASHELAPECAGGTCLLDLRKEAIGSCFQSPADCLGWFADPDKASKYSCHYGTHAVDLAECTIYAPTFEPGSTTTGDTYGDPESGAAVSNPSATAGADPDGSGEACWPSGWAVFNPLEWVYRPITCAFEWAFVPRDSVIVAAQSRIDTLIAESPPGTIASTIATADWSGFESGCQGVQIDMSWLQRDAFVGAEFPELLTIAEACPGDPLEPLAMFSSVLIGGAAVVVCFRTWPSLLGRIFNYSGVDG